MPIDKTSNQPEGNSLGPKPPTNPVEFARWVQRPRVNPKKPKVRPDDSALLPEPLEKPEVNHSIGTDKPKRSKLKNPNNTRLPEYLRPTDGLKSPPVQKSQGLITFLQWFHDNDSAIELNKMSPASLAARTWLVRLRYSHQGREAKMATTDGRGIQPFHQEPGRCQEGQGARTLWA